MILHFTLATRDVRRTSEFFARTLGWRPIEQPGNILSPAAWLEIAPNQQLHLIQVEGFFASPFESEYGRHVAITYPLEGFAELKTRLRQAGAQVFAAERPTPFERFFFSDPNGYVFEVVDSNHAGLAGPSEQEPPRSQGPCF